MKFKFKIFIWNKGKNYLNNFLISKIITQNKHLLNINY